MRNDPDFLNWLRPEKQEHAHDPAGTALMDAAWSILRPLEGVAYGKDSIGEKSEKQYVPDSWSTFTGEIKETASFLGAALAGVARVNRLWLYTHQEDEVVPESIETSIVMAVEMDRSLIHTSPSAGADAATGNGYARMAFIAKGMVEYIRRLGWRAIGCGNDTALSIPLAIDAGLGECGRNGLLATSRHGSRIRICKVFTDMPLIPDQPITIGMSERCNTCRRCVKACPVDAISNGERTAKALNVSSNPGVMKWPVDGEKCRRFWSVNGASCANCISACPLS